MQGEDPEVRKLYINELSKEEKKNLCCDLHLIPEFQPLPTKTMVRIAELCESYFNRGKDYKSIPDIKTEGYIDNLREQIASFKREIGEYEDELSHFENLLMSCLESKTIDEVRQKILNHRSKNFELHKFKWQK